MMDLWADRDYVERYNRLYQLKSEEIASNISILDLTSEDCLVDFGCGNGDFLATCASRVKRSVGVDGSAPQLKELRRRVAGLPIQIVESSFQDFDPAGWTFTKGFARASLHHLQDEEKVEFFRRVGRAFAPGARFLLRDMIFRFPKSELVARETTLVEEAIAFYGKAWAEKRDDVLHTWHYEFPTDLATWTRALEAGGFHVVLARPITSFLGTLLAEKKAA